MPSTKKRRRAKRHAENLAEEAIEAAASGQHHLAEKLIERALSAGPANARFWLERARIALLRGATGRAERAVRRALALPGHLDLLLRGCRRHMADRSAAEGLARAR